MPKKTIKINIKESEERDNYYENILFSLCLLSIPMQFKTLLKFILYFSIADLGVKAYKSYEKNLAKDNNDYLFVEDTPYDYENLNSKEKKIGFIEIEADKRNLKIHNINCLLPIHKLFSKYIKEYENENGKDARIKMKISLINEVRNAQSLTEKEFRTLCAVYSCLGKSRYKIIRNNLIRYRILGYKSKMAFEGSFRKERKLISDKVIRRINIKLSSRSFYERIYYKRNNYYSKVLRNGKLEQKIFSLSAKKLIDKSKIKIFNNNLSKKERILNKYINSGKYTINDILKVKDKMMNNDFDCETLD